VLTSGKLWGEDMILMSAHLQSKYCARAMNYLEVYMISREELVDVARNFPLTFKRIRRSAILMALRREIVLRAKEEKGVSEDSQLTGSNSATFDMMLHRAGVVTEAERQTQQRILEAKRSTGQDNILSKTDSRQTQKSIIPDIEESSEDMDTSGGLAARRSSSPSRLSRRSDDEKSEGRRSEDDDPAGLERRKSEPSFMALSKKMSRGTGNNAIKKKPSLVAVANAAGDMAEILTEQKAQQATIQRLEESIDTFRVEHKESMDAVSSELARIAAVLSGAPTRPSVQDDS